MNTTSQPKFSAMLRNAGRLAMQWRLLLLWVVTLLIPTTLLALPIWRLFAAQLDHSVHAAELAQKLDMNSLYDLGGAMHVNGMAMAEAGVAALVLTLALSPFLSGMVITAARAPAPLPLGKLVHGGVTEYGRMLRMLIWAVLPLGVAGGLGAGAMHLADKYAETAIVEHNADLANYAATIVLVLLLLIADATVEAARAQLALDTRKRSVIKAWWRACKLVFKHPLTSFGAYLVITLIGLVLMALLGLLRINMPHATTAGFVGALLLTQVLAVISGWMRSARLFALIEMAKGHL